MYIHSNNLENVYRPLRVTRANTKFVFKTETRCTTAYLRSPFYKGTVLWNVLGEEVQKSNSIVAFMKKIDGMYMVYEEIW